MIPGLPFGLSGARKPLVFVGAISTTFSFGSGSLSLTTLSGGARSSAQSGDLVLVFVMPNANNSSSLNSVVTTSGYTELFDVPQLAGNNSFIIAMSCSRKLLSSAETSVAFTANQSVGGSAIAYVFSGANQANPIDVSPVTTTGVGATGGVNPPAITTATQNATVVAATIGAYNITGAPSGMSGFVSASTDTGAAFINRQASGPYDPPAFANTGAIAGSISPWIAATIALRPK